MAFLSEMLDHGDRPVRSSYAKMPRAHQSVKRPPTFPERSSGAIYEATTSIAYGGVTNIYITGAIPQPQTDEGKARDAHAYVNETPHGRHGTVLALDLACESEVDNLDVAPSIEHDVLDLHKGFKQLTT